MRLREVESSRQANSPVDPFNSSAQNGRASVRTPTCPDQLNAASCKCQVTYSADGGTAPLVKVMIGLASGLGDYPIFRTESSSRDSLVSIQAASCPPPSKQI
jgi:hypothetical protein